MLDDTELAIERVRTRVNEGGHDIPEEVIKRRFRGGLVNFFNLYQSTVNEWILVSNSANAFEIVARYNEKELTISSIKKWEELKKTYEHS